MPEALWNILPWAVVALCIVLEAFFAAAELSIVSANRIELERAAREGNLAARRVIWFRDHPDQLFGTTLVGTNGCTVTGTTVASLTLLQIDPARGDWFAMALMAPLVLMGGEIIPKSLAQARAITVSQLLSGPLTIVHRVLSPIVALVRAYTRLLWRALGIRADQAGSPVASREELVLLMQSDAVTADDVNEDEREMISRIFAFGHLRARDTMVPLVEMVAVPHDASVRQAAAIIAQVGFSRLPVYKDRIDDVVGLLHHLDVLQARSPDQPISELMRPPYFVPETQEVDEILIILQRQSTSAAIVVDEFGGAVGLITLEDVLEEIVGDIADEYDRQTGMWRQVADGWVVSARTSVEALNDAFDVAIPLDAEYETLAGYLLEALRHIPRAGEAVTLPSGARLTVRRANDRAIQEVHLAGARRRT